MRATGSPSHSAYYWLATRFDGTRLGLLTVEGLGGSVLPVFGSRQGARDFILSRRGPERWWARPTGTGELVSMLLGSRPGVERVVLDPSPKTLEGRWTGPVGRSREGFIDSLLEGDGARPAGDPGQKRPRRSRIRATRPAGHRT